MRARRTLAWIPLVAGLLVSAPADAAVGEDVKTAFYHARKVRRWRDPLKPNMRRYYLRKMFGLRDGQDVDLGTVSEISLRDLSDLILDIKSDGESVADRAELIALMIDRVANGAQANAEALGVLRLLEGFGGNAAARASANPAPAAASSSAPPPLRLGGPPGYPGAPGYPPQPAYPAPAYGGYPAAQPGAYPQPGGYPPAQPGGYAAPAYPQPSYGGGQAVDPKMVAAITAAVQAAMQSQGGGTAPDPAAVAAQVQAQLSRPAAPPAGTTPVFSPPPAAAAPSRGDRLAALRARAATRKAPVWTPPAAPAAPPPPAAPAIRLQLQPVDAAPPAPPPAPPQAAPAEPPAPRGLDQRTHARFSQAVEPYKGKSLAEIRKMVKDALYSENRITRFTPRPTVVAVDAAVEGKVKNLLKSFEQLGLPAPQ